MPISLLEIAREENKDLNTLKEMEDFEELQDFLVDYSSDKLADVASKVEALTEEGKTLGELLEIPSALLELYYNCANDVFQAKKYKEAADSFIFLTMMDPYAYDYWMPLALSEHMNKNYAPAMSAYSIAAMIDTENPTPHFFAGTCFREQEQNEEARGSLETCIALCEVDEKWAEIAKEAQKNIDALR